MKKNIHPVYQEVLFVDSSTGDKFVIGSTLQPDAKEKHEGIEYPVHRVAVSSASHPFFTGSSQLIDTEGRIDKFKKRYQAKQGQKKEEQEDEAPAKKPAPKTKKPKKK